MSQAKVIPNEFLAEAAERITKQSMRPWQDAVIFALSFRAGLRACEMAGIRWTDVTDVMGRVVEPGKMWHVPDNIAKKGGGRRIPMHPDLHRALVAAKANMPAAAVKGDKHVILKAKALPDPDDNFGGLDPRFIPTTPNALQKYIGRRWRQAGFDGVSSHSGRRTFITELARRANKHGCSLRDVQLLAGHSEIATTERYIDLSDNVDILVGSL